LVIKNTQYTIRKTQNLKGKRVLITAGPTWVPIDSVRVISNIATGETGVLLAEKLQGIGAKATLLLGPAGACCLDKKIKLIRFRFFAELKNIMIKELTSKRYDVVIHSAALSDYKPIKIYSYKVKSDIKNWQINLVPTEKIIDSIKKMDDSLFLVGFKFSTEAKKYKLVEDAKKLMVRANLDLVVTNTLNKNRYQAYIINQNKIYGTFYNKNTLADKLIEVMEKNLMFRR
jgi:phosphopantothenoylcysteine decarboxylase/phosphopantothenate--cysteine ligase